MDRINFKLINNLQDSLRSIKLVWLPLKLTRITKHYDRLKNIFEFSISTTADLLELNYKECSQSILIIM